MEPPSGFGFKPPPYSFRSKPTCRLSDPALPHQLCRRRRGSHPPFSMCFSCKRNKHFKDSKYYYYCATCNLEFHRRCHIFLPEIRHPFHPSHPLTRISVDPEINDFLNHKNDGSYFSEEETHEVDDDDDHNNIDDDFDFRKDDDDEDDFDFVVDDDDDDTSLSDGNRSNCKCCQSRLQKVYYHCSICKFNLDLRCALRAPPPTTISHLKSHEHSLTLFPRRLPLPCDVCGWSLSDTKDLVYACLPCSRMVHRSCIYLPRVIQITRHPHRLSLTSSLPPGDFACGVCRKTVDVNYGQYSCNKLGCHYAVHSKCATRKDVWDGKDLEGVPEDPEEVLEPFVRIDEETIQHFSHDEHYLRLHEKTTICEKDKFCEACTLPIMISQTFYGCMQCEFVLDEACASLPRKKYHPLHKHPLTLHPFPSGDLVDIRIGVQDMFRCSGCRRFSCGFVYKCNEDYCKFNLDVRCASLPDPLIHGCHPHDLFFNLTSGNCMGCGSDMCSSYFLECIKCKSFLGITCATLPSEAHYKHDRHPLTLCYGEEDTSSGQYWCEICESKLDPKKWFYTCGSCRITLHVNCLLGHGIYMKPGHHTFKVYHVHGDREVLEFKIARNDGNSRLICYYCNRRCAQTLVFNGTSIHVSFGTLKCVGMMLVEMMRNASGYDARHGRLVEMMINDD